MKGHDKVIEVLNGLLADELTAINQYMVHAEMCDNWGYAHLHQVVEGRARDEMKHAERLIARILFLEGQPNVSMLNKILVGADVSKQLVNDLSLEMTAVKNYNQAIKVAADLGDNTTREMLDTILQDEDRHVNDIEADQDQIGQMGVQNYLVAQIRE